MKFLLRDRRGISLIEVIIVVTILTMLIGLASTSFFPVRGRASLDTNITTFLTDLRSQQIKAMTGDTQGTGSNVRYGVHFEQTTYTLFRGSVYSASDPSNTIISLGDGISILSTTFPQDQIVFATGSGEIIGITGTNSIDLKNNLSNEQKSININRYGATTSIN